MTFIPKFHILAARGKKVEFLHISANLEDFLTEMEKSELNEKDAPSRYLSGMWPPFFHFQSGNASKSQKTCISAILEDFLTEKGKKSIFSTW